MRHIYILVIIIGFPAVLIGEDVQLSIENSSKLEYVGYVWANNKFVFLSPYLKATAIKERSVSEKICGYELSSTSKKTVPFMVYLVDEISGLGEIQVKPHIDLDHHKESTMHFNIEAYDCDNLPHYSNRASVEIHISKAFGPVFNKSAYSFSIKKDSNIGSVIGTVNAKGSDNSKIRYSLYHIGKLPFEIDDLGTITTTSTLRSIKSSLIYLRVIATEQIEPIPRQSITSITIEMLPICENKVNGIPDQLDYKIKYSANALAESEQLIQDQHQPLLTICYFDSPLKLMRLEISLIQSRGPPAALIDNTVCQSNIVASRLQRRACNADPGTIDLFLTQGGMIVLNEGSTIGPEIIPSLKYEFTLMWWMKRENKRLKTIFCFQIQGLQEEISLEIMDCKIVISISGKKEYLDIPTETCLLDTWQLYSVSQELKTSWALKVTVADNILPPLSVKEDIFHSKSLRYFVGECPSSARKIKLKGANEIQIGVISLSKDISLSRETVGCMSTCGEVLLAIESMKKWSDVSFQRQGSSLIFTSTSIPNIVKMLSKVGYINSYYSAAGKQSSNKISTHVAIDFYIYTQSGETITIPRSLMKVNVVLPQKERTNDTTDVDIYATSTVFAKQSHSILLLPDFRFIDSNNEEPIKRDTRIEACSIRPLQRNFLESEKIYLTRLMMPIVIGNKLRIKFDPGSWTLEGDGTSDLYESLLRHVTFDMVNERRKLFIVCTLKSGEVTSQAFIDVIQPKKNKITIIREEHATALEHNSLNERKGFSEKEDEKSKDSFSITKSKFIAVVIMAVVGGATWAVISVAITCFIIRRRGNLKMRNRIKTNGMKTYQRQSSPTFLSGPLTMSNPHNICPQYEYDEDRISMADIPDADENCLDNISCDTCNMADHENICTNVNSVKEIPRSKTINFPIIHKRF